MKLNYPIFDQAILIREGTILAIESRPIFAKMTQDFYQYSESSDIKLFTSNLSSLKDTELMLVTDILGYDLNSPSILKLIHADIEGQLNDKPEVKSMIEKLTTTITELLVFECLENELDLEYDEITLLELIKALGVKIETRSDTIFEKCFEILQSFKYLHKKKLLVFFNVCSYLSQREIQQLQEYITLSQLTVLFIEPRKVYDFPQYILDEDYFLWSKNMI